MKKLTTLLLLLGATVALTAFKAPQPGSWEKLGQRMVNMKADHDVIPVTIMEGTFTAVRFKVMKAPIHLLNVKIHYGNGESHNLAINKRIPKGATSKVFDLPGKRRIIKKITFNYKTIPSGNGRALIVAYGRH